MKDRLTGVHRHNLMFQNILMYTYFNCEVQDSVKFEGVSRKFPDGKKLFTCLSAFPMSPVVPVLSRTAWRISATPVRPEPPGLRHQGFSQTEHREVWMAVHPALPLFCINCPQSCGLPHFHQWVSIAGTRTFLFHLLYIFL